MTKKPMIFAPLEGITDALFRTIILELYPEWDYVYTDFFRVPPEGKISSSRLIDHLGEKIFNNQELRAKSPFQILASPTSQSALCARQLDELELPWIDLNVGCPSRKVNAHHGGAWLMGHPNELKSIITAIRSNFSGKFSVKIRSGYQDSSTFDEIIKIVEGEGADLLTIHPRTKVMMYQGYSDWNFIRRAKEQLSIPVIGNGDIHTNDDINEMLSTTNCDGIMIGRGAVGNPALAALYKDNKTEMTIKKYLESFIDEIKAAHGDDVALKRLKSITHYLFSGEHKTELLRSRSLSEFQDKI